MVPTIRLTDDDKLPEQDMVPLLLVFVAMVFQPLVSSSIAHIRCCQQFCPARQQFFASASV
jgi:hypothetical protein